MVSERDVQAFADDGVLVLRNVVAPVWLERIAQAIERDIADPAPFVHGYAAADGAAGDFTATCGFGKPIRAWPRSA